MGNSSTTTLPTQTDGTRLLTRSLLLTVTAVLRVIAPAISQENIPITPEVAMEKLGVQSNSLIGDPDKQSEIVQAGNLMLSLARCVLASSGDDYDRECALLMRAASWRLREKYIFGEILGAPLDAGMPPGRKISGGLTLPSDHITPAPGSSTGGWEVKANDVDRVIVLDDGDWRPDTANGGQFFGGGVRSPDRPLFTDIPEKWHNLDEASSVILTLVMMHELCHTSQDDAERQPVDDPVARACYQIEQEIDCIPFDLKFVGLMERYLHCIIVGVGVIQEDRVTGMLDLLSVIRKLKTEALEEAQSK